MSCFNSKNSRVSLEVNGFKLVSYLPSSMKTCQCEFIIMCRGNWGRIFGFSSSYALRCIVPLNKLILEYFINFVLLLCTSNRVWDKIEVHSFSKLKSCTRVTISLYC